MVHEEDLFLKPCRYPRVAHISVSGWIRFSTCVAEEIYTLDYA